MAAGKIAGKVAILTGGAQSIGGGCARCLAADGAQVLIVDIDSETAAQNAERIQQAGGAASEMAGDVAEESVAAEMVDCAVEEYGRLDILVQNAFSGGAWMLGTAVEIEPEGITVNAIAPGHIVTENMRKMWDEMGNDEGYRLFELHYPVRRLGRPEDIGAAVTFLCAPEASFITGQTLAVDGGQTVQLQENIVMDVKDFIVEHPDLKTHFDQPNGGVPRR